MSAKAVDVSCESVVEWRGQATCHMDETTAITTDDAKISDARNENFTHLSFFQNSEISFLPIEIHEKMPNLNKITAFLCSISKISKKNFSKLTKVLFLDLRYNKIEKIQSDTFEDLLELKTVWLGKLVFSELEEKFKFFISFALQNTTELNSLTQSFSKKTRD